VQVIETQRRERSVARNAGASVAKGRYLHFLDDDDWLAPGAFQALWELSRRSPTAWLYGMTQLVDGQDCAILKLRHGLNGNCLVQTLAGEWVPLQASLIEAEVFFKVGGFNPTLTGPEDIDLLRRVASVGELSETPKVVANLAMGHAGSTTDYDKHPSAARRAREDLLNGHEVFGRGLDSAAGSSFWLGKLCRVYSTSVVWNLGHAHLSAACSRLALAMAAFASANLEMLRLDFWRGLALSYQSPSFERKTGNKA
jgi:hypothetical protein